MALVPRKDLTLEETRSNRLSAIALIVMILASIGLDQSSKLHAMQSLMEWSHESNIELYKGKRHPVGVWGDEFSPDANYVSFGLNYVRNEGAAWGMLRNMPDTVRIPFFFAITVLAVGILFVFFRQTPHAHRLARFAIALIFSGAIGNFIDRVRLKYVIDWIDVQWRIGGWSYSFPNFNIADSAITVGVALLMIDMIILDAIRRRRLDASGAGHAAAISQKLDPKSS